MTRRRLGVLISGRGSNLQSLIDACAQPDFPAQISVVISNRPEALGIERAKFVGLPTQIIDHKLFDTRLAFETALTNTLEKYNVDLVCLAGFMRLLTPTFVEHWHDRLLNIHPSLLPSFKGVHVHEQALAAGVKIHGCTVHYVRPEMDAGPIVGQAAVPVLATDDAATLGARVLSAEHLLYPACIRAVCEGKVSIANEVCILSSFTKPTATLLNPG